MLFKLYRNRFVYIMLIPAVIMVLVFNYMPLAGWFMAFKKYKVGHSIWTAEWNGFNHFNTFFAQGNDYLYLIRNTLIMNISSIIIGLLLAMTFAILLNEIRWRLFVKSVQTISFFPFFVSWIIIYSMVYALFAQESGIINQIMVNSGILESGINIMGDPKYSWALIVTITVWKNLGYNSIIFIAAISSINSEEYEAAEIDGAGRFGKIFNVTVPNLLPTLIVLFIINSGYIFSSDFGQYLVFTNATNIETMEVLDMYIYKFGLKQLNFSYATAVEMVKSFVSIVVVVVVNLYSKKMTGKAIF